MKKLIWIVIIVIVVIALVSINKGDKVPATSGEPIKIGVIAPLTGIVADYGEEIRKGVVAAGVTGVEFIFEDDKCDPKEAVTAFKKLTEFDQVKFVIGPACGSPQEVIIPLLQEREAIVLVPSAASRSLFVVSNNRFYNMQYALEDESTFLANKMYDLGHYEVVLISYQNAFSKTHRDTFVANFKGKVVKEISFADDTADVSTELTKLKIVPHDSIFSTDIAFFFAQGLDKLRRFGITTPVFSQYAVELPVVRPLVEGVTYSFPGDLLGQEGAVFNLSKEAATVLGGYVVGCNGDYQCVADKFNSDPSFVDGVKQRTIILKKIENGQAVVY